MKSIILLCFFLAGSFAVAAQNFLEGYYVNNSRDTIRGFIENRSDQKNFSSFIFKTSSDATAQAFRIDDAAAFGIGKETIFQRQSYEKISGEVIEGFFKVVVLGKLSLLNFDSRYYAMTENEEIYDVTRFTVEASGAKRDDFRALGNMKLLMKDCETTNEQWLTKQYSDRNLEKIFVTYNQCMNSKVIVTKDVRGKALVNFGVQVLPSWTTMNDGYPMSAIDMGNNNTVAGGIFVSINNPIGWNRKISLLIEANYYQYKGHATTTSDEVSYYANHDITTTYSGLHLPIILRYGQRFFFDIGFQNHFVLTQSTKWHVERVSISSGRVINTGYNQPLNIQAYTIGLLIGGGMKFNVGSFPLRVFARYSRNGSSFFTGTPAFQSASVGVALQLTRH